MNQGKKPSWFPECPWGDTNNKGEDNSTLLMRYGWNRAVNDILAIGSAEAIKEYIKDTYKVVEVNKDTLVGGFSLSPDGCHIEFKGENPMVKLRQSIDKYEKDKFKYRGQDTHDYINDSAEIRVREYIKGKSIIPEIKPSLWQRFVWWVFFR